MDMVKLTELYTLIMYSHKYTLYGSRCFFLGVTDTQLRKKLQYSYLPPIFLQGVYAYSGTSALRAKIYTQAHHF